MRYKVYSDMQYQRPRSPFTLTPWVRGLIVANAAVYLLTITVLTGRWFLTSFAFTPAAVIQQPWTLFSYMFLHGGVMHLAFNMLVLFFFGPAVEEQLGNTSFARYYFLCGLGGAALSFVFALQTPIIGASAAVFGVSLAFAVYWPNAPIYVFPIPFPIKAKWLVGFLAVSSLLLAVLGTSDGVAHFAHLGGFLFGAAYLGRQRGWFARLKPATAKPHATKVLFVHPTADQPTNGSEKNNRWTDENIQREVDRVLDKISASGIESLTRDERNFLDRMSKVMREH
ncbi:MAG: rhomboid family intramembrane serine protease [Gemmatimonadales bacterium]